MLSAICPGNSRCPSIEASRRLKLPDDSISPTTQAPRQINLAGDLSLRLKLPGAFFRRKRSFKCTFSDSQLWQLACNVIVSSLQVEEVLTALGLQCGKWHIHAACNVVRYPA